MWINKCPELYLKRISKILSIVSMTLQFPYFLLYSDYYKKSFFDNFLDGILFYTLLPYYTPVRVHKVPSTSPLLLSLSFDWFVSICFQLRRQQHDHGRRAQVGPHDDEARGGGEVGGRRNSGINLNSHSEKKSWLI